MTIGALKGVSLPAIIPQGMTAGSFNTKEPKPTGYENENEIGEVRGRRERKALIVTMEKKRRVVREQERGKSFDRYMETDFYASDNNF